MLFRTSIARASQLSASASRHAHTSLLRSPAPLAACKFQQKRFNAGHAISNPTLADIERRWESMPPQEQADLWMALRDRMKKDWNEMTTQEKKAAYWIAFGPHGPRAEPPPGEGWKVFRYTMYGLVVSSIVFAITRYFARPPPRTMTKEWQEASNEYMKSQNINPITGISSEGYKGRGMVQSRTAKEQGISLEPEE
ncbi:COX4-domain-containing protein [Rhizodiscina lignyota]|uniref:Cytochrome c oxidase polypeptide V n=1 Tax=Rhizodiscina lignyota TaxID=1504668 RepID=A0A9P4I3E6_9PEZI|nr:COX4-domain-containing protein [Rhizodiscina lignyota]